MFPLLAIIIYLKTIMTRGKIDKAIFSIELFILTHFNLSFSSELFEKIQIMAGFLALRSSRFTIFFNGLAPKEIGVDQGI